MSEEKTNMLKNKKAKPVILIIIILLLLAIASSIIILERNKNIKTDAIKTNKNFTITLDGKEKIYTIDDLKRFTQVTKYKKYSSSSGETEEGNFTGVELKDIVNDLGSKKKPENYLIKATDGYQTVFTESEVSKKNNILLVYKKNNKKLPQKMGTFCILYLGYPFGQKNVKMVNKIIVT
ncbi:MAG: molybdopterin-dependent oxidoreductase [Clostridiales Family XIII bacterium]|jgi:hypothetical protein|nr:molybdopterin-dependent oxidoreductase [Clostridiales Family XIII bacterium]